MAADDSTHRFGDMLRWGQPFLDVIDNPKVEPCLREILGEGFRLDHIYLDVIRSGLSPIGATLHGGGTPYNPIMSYDFRNGRMYSGLFVAAYNLARRRPGRRRLRLRARQPQEQLPLSGRLEGPEPAAAVRAGRDRAGRHRGAVHGGADSRRAALVRGRRAPHAVLQVPPPRRVLGFHLSRPGGPARHQEPAPHTGAAPRTRPREASRPRTMDTVSGGIR